MLLHCIEPAYLTGSVWHHCQHHCHQQKEAAGAQQSDQLVHLKVRQQLRQHHFGSQLVRNEDMDA